MRSMTDHSRGSGIHAGMSKGFEEFRRHHRVAPLHFVGMNRNHHDIRLPLRLADLSHCPFQVDGSVSFRSGSVSRSFSSKFIPPSGIVPSGYGDEYPVAIR